MAARIYQLNLVLDRVSQVLFLNLLAFYPYINFLKSLDGVNFSNNTIWEGNLSEQAPYLFEKEWGKQFISEGTILKFIRDENYDFVLVNNLEHIANPFLPS